MGRRSPARPSRGHPQRVSEECLPKVPVHFERHGHIRHRCNNLHSASLLHCKQTTAVGPNDNSTAIVGMIVALGQAQCSLH